MTPETYDGTVARIGFGPGPDGPYMVSVDVDELVPPFKVMTYAHFQLSEALTLTLNGEHVTFRELVTAMNANIPFRAAKVRIVWVEHSYIGVSEAHFTVPT